MRRPEATKLPMRSQVERTRVNQDLRQAQFPRAVIRETRHPQPWIEDEWARTAQPACLAASSSLAFGGPNRLPLHPIDLNPRHLRQAPPLTRSIEHAEPYGHRYIPPTRRNWQGTRRPLPDRPTICSSHRTARSDPDRRGPAPIDQTSRDPAPASRDQSERVGQLPRMTRRGRGWSASHGATLGEPVVSNSGPTVESWTQFRAGSRS